MSNMDPKNTKFIVHSAVVPLEVESFHDQALFSANDHPKASAQLDRQELVAFWLLV